MCFKDISDLFDHIANITSKFEMFCAVPELSSFEAKIVTTTMIILAYIEK